MLQLSSKLYLFITLLLLSLVTSQVRAAVSHDSSLDWYSLESEHFQIHYHNGIESQARDVLAMAERVHGELSVFIDWQPSDKTEIVLTDEYDHSNGYATPYPSNRMTMFLSAPDEINSLEDHGGWLELLFTHEYLHILHLDKAEGAPSVLRKIFGRFILFFPNALQPSWFTEGLATYVETDGGRGIGRGQSSYYDMLMRMESLDGIKPLRQVNQPIASWPMGTTPYLYGVFFYQYLVAMYGEDKVVELVDNYSDNIIPFRILSNTRQVLGVDIDTLWNDFSAYLKQHYRNQREAIRSRGETRAAALTKQGYFNGPLADDGAGNLYYYAYDAQTPPALMRLKIDGKSERLTDVAFGARFDFHPQQGLLVAQAEVCRNAAYYFDLYRYDRDGGGKQRLTRCGRYRMAAWSPEGERIVAVHNAAGRNELHLLDSEGKQQKVLWRGEEGVVVSYMDWSPDGRTLVASLWRPDNGWDLELFDFEQRSWRALTETKSIENHPRFIAGGSSLLFSADYDGVYNIYRMDLVSGEVVALSNVLGGAFHPVQGGADGALYYVGYDKDGFDLYRTDGSDPVERQVTMVEAGDELASAEPKPVMTSKAHDYSPISSMLPRWWLPHIDVVIDSHAEVGATTAGWDTLNRHSYAITYAYDVDNHWGVGSFDYIYDRWLPILKLHASSTYDKEYDSDDELLKIRRDTNYQAEVVLPYITRDSRWALHLGAGEETESDSRLEQGAVAEPDKVDRIAGAGIVYKSTSTQPRSVSRADGREVMLVAEDSDLIDGSDYSGQAVTVDWKEFFRLGGEHVLGVRLIAAEGDDTIRPFQLGGVEDVNYLPMIFDNPAANSPLNRREYGLRGYEDDLPQLSGSNLHFGAIEYRFPVWRLERGWMTPPLGLHQLHGALFAEAGAAWSVSRKPDQYYSSYGAELSADAVLFYNAGFNLTLGYAHGVDEIGEDQVYLRIGASF